MSDCGKAEVDTEDRSQRGEGSAAVAIIRDRTSRGLLSRGTRVVDKLQTQLGGGQSVPKAKDERPEQVGSAGPECGGSLGPM